MTPATIERIVRARWERGYRAEVVGAAWKFSVWVRHVRFRLCAAIGAAAEESHHRTQLALIRLAARAIEDPRARHEVEQAQFHLFAALECGDANAASQWIRTLRVAARAIPQWATDDVTAALVEIERR